VRSSAVHNRRLGYAVAISLVAHAVLLYGSMPFAPDSPQEPATPPPLVTRIVELPKPEPEPPPPEEKKAPAPRRQVRKPATAKPLPPPAPAEPAPSPSPVAPPPVASAPPVAGAPAAPAAPPPVDARAAEAETAAQYRTQLIAYARRHKPPYPSIARDNNWTGDVVLEISIRADGRGELGLRRGSGHAVLDKLALDTYQEALRAVPVPPTLRGKQVRLEPLRVIYNLTE
jgi:TonB family protein